MSNAQLEAAIEAAWDARDTITPSTGGETREAIEATLNALDSGSLRVAEKQDDGSWHVNQWAKKAVLLGFRIKDMETARQRSARRQLVGQGRQQVQGLGRQPVARCRLPCGAELCGPQIGIHRGRAWC